MPLITRVPVRELTIIFAGGAPRSTSRFSSTETNETFWAGSFGALTRILFVSSGIAVSAPKLLLITSATLLAVEKSPRCRLSITKSVFKNSVGTSLSTDAPRGIRPTVGIFTVREELSAPVTPRPPTTMFPCAIAYVSPSAPNSGAINKVPPLRDPAPPIVDTVTSIACPGLVNGGKSAVIITAAALSPLRPSTSDVTPNLDTRDCID